MLKRIVPTPGQKPLGPETCAGGFAVASIANTSSSGKLNFTKLDQLRLSSSTHWLPLNFTIKPVSGPAVPLKFVVGGGRPPLLLTMPSVMVVVRLPDWKTAA